MTARGSESIRRVLFRILVILVATVIGLVAIRITFEFMTLMTVENIAMSFFTIQTMNQMIKKITIKLAVQRMTKESYCCLTVRAAIQLIAKTAFKMTIKMALIAIIKVTMKNYW